MQYSQLRQDRTSGRWVIIAPQRQARPGAPRSTARPVGSSPAFDAHCPFCPGNESQLLGIADQTSTDAGWTVRVVPNKYPAVHPRTPEHHGRKNGPLQEGYGFHEVIIESPFHDADLVSISDAGLNAVIAAYRNRSRHLLSQPGIEAVVVFRNYGPAAGASIAHPHAQIIALGLIPPKVATLADWGQRYHNDHGRCATCEEVGSEAEQGQRVVEDSRNFLAIVPFAARHPFETWIVPKQHHASFVQVDDQQLPEFGNLLRNTLRRLRQTHGNPAYNFVIDSGDRQLVGAPYMHWRLRIVPRLSKSAGFELASGIAINASLPEQDAAILRTASVEAVAR